jgi:arylsulfatase A-like enzyme
MHGYDANKPPPGWDSWFREPGRSYDKKKKNGYVTDVMAKEAVAVIDEAAGAGDPLFLWFAAKAPHGPARPAKRHHDAFPDAKGEDRDRLRSLLAVDEAVVAMHDAMGPRWDDACVLVLSDNGYLLGEHGHVGKTIWWDGAVRVPMLARCPGLGGGDDTRLAASIDITPTILSAAGVPVPANVDGRPLQTAWQRDGVLIENWAEHPFTGVKTATLAYVEAKGEKPALYTLADGETVNHLDGPDDPLGGDAWAAWLADLRDCMGADCG